MSRRGRTCECGRAKAVGAEACPRCTELDGDGMPEKKLIDALRQVGGEGTTEAVLVESGMSYRAFRRASAKLEASGRVVREQEETTWQKASGGQGAAVLTLVHREQPRWRQLRFPPLVAYLEPVEVREAPAESRGIVNVRRAVPRQRARQMKFSYRRARSKERRL